MANIATAPPGAPPPTTPAPATTPGTATPPVAPVAQQVEHLSPTEAQTRLAELRSDPTWRASLIKNWARDSSAEKTLFNELTRRAAGQAATEAKPEPTESERALATLEPPPSPADYKLVDHGNRPIQLDDENKTVVNEQLLPAAHSLGLAQGDIDGIALAVLRPMGYEACDQLLRRAWGSGFEQGLEDFRSAIAANPAARQILERYPEQIGNNGFAILRITEAWRRRNAKR